ncbi:ORFL165W [Human betaherpesvirus 5]|nr:ORFL165W [Human betaherpesvirus 5]QHX40506.1 ORFL165W [Human betaherpesvirus 5]
MRSSWRASCVEVPKKPARCVPSMRPP